MKNPLSFQNIFLQKFSKLFLHIEGQSYQRELGILEDLVNVSSLSTWYWAKGKSPRGQGVVIDKEIDQINKCSEDNGNKISH